MLAVLREREMRVSRLGIKVQTRLQVPERQLGYGPRALQQPNGLTQRDVHGQRVQADEVLYGLPGRLPGRMRSAA